MSEKKFRTAILFIAPVLGGVFIAVGPFQDHASFIMLGLIFYALCIWVWRVMVAVAAALVTGWGLSYIVSANAGTLSLVLLVLGLVLGILWHVRHRRSIAKDDVTPEKIS